MLIHNLSSSATDKMMMVIMIVIRMMIVNAGYDFHLMAS